MKRERALQVVLLLVGLLYLAWALPLLQSLWHSSWLEQHQDAFPMFMSVNIVLGVFLLLAVRQPARHRSLIAFGAWSTLAHAFTMTIRRRSTARAKTGSDVRVSALEKTPDRRGSPVYRRQAGAVRVRGLTRTL